MDNLAIGSYIPEGGVKVFKSDRFLMDLFNLQIKEDGKTTHNAKSISKNEIGEVLGVMCKCGSIHPFIEGKINWENSVKEESKIEELI